MHKEPPENQRLNTESKLKERARCRSLRRTIIREQNIYLLDKKKKGGPQTLQKSIFYANNQSACPLKQTLLKCTARTTCRETTRNSQSPLVKKIKTIAWEITKRDIQSYLLLLHRWASVVARTWVVVVDSPHRVVDTAGIRRIRLGEGNSPDQGEVPAEDGMIVVDTEVLRCRNLYST